MESEKIQPCIPLDQFESIVLGRILILHAALDETFFCACLRLGNKWTCACCCFSPADAATFASSPSTGTAVKVWNFRVNKLSNSARWSLCACARHCWIAA